MSWCTSAVNGSYFINDPGNASITSLNTYMAGLPGFVPGFQTVGFVHAAPGDRSSLYVTSDDAADFMIVDSQGRRTGYSPLYGVLQEIPHSAYQVTAPEQYLGGPPGAKYTWQISPSLRPGHTKSSSKGTGPAPINCPLAP